jgi:hypothetical protein
MRISRVLTGFAAVITAAAGVSLAAAGPASAALPPGQGGAGIWRAFGNTNPVSSSSSEWHCAASEQIGVNVVAQVCVINSADDLSVQAAVIVRNNKPVEYDAQASMSLMAAARTFTSVCPLSGVAPDSWSVCFGPTVGNTSPVFAKGSAGDLVDLGTTPPIV